MAPRKKSEKKTASEPAPAPVEAPAPVPAPEPAPVPVQEEVPIQNTVVQPAATTASKKKTKKQVQVVALVTPNGIEGNFQPVEQRRSLIAHLQVHSNQVKFTESSFEYDPNPPKAPEPYDGDGDDPFSNYTRATFETVQPSGQVEKETETLGKLVPIADPLGNPQHSSRKDSATDDDSKPLQPFYRCNLMIQYRDTVETRKLPDSVDTSCFWCTECFEWQPTIIPEREDKGVYKVYGNFCSPECALAFLLEEIIDPHVRWERMALLHRMYSELYTDRIFPSPPRQSLKKFGGPMSVDQFRATAKAKQVRVDIQLPPLVSILGTMDTKPIDFYDTNIRSPTGIATERILKAEEGLRLRRNKPLKDKESTLDACMKISIKTKPLGE
jgi:hypothetical protein